MTIVTHAYRPKRAEAQGAGGGDHRPDDRHGQEQANQRTHQQVPSAATSEPATIVTTAKNPHRHAGSATCPI